MSDEYKSDVQCAASVHDIPGFAEGLQVSVVFVHQGDRLLFLKNAKHKCRSDGAWGLPGGKWEPGESHQQCAQRELKEETCIDLPISSFDFLGHYYVAIRDAYPIHYTLHVFYARVVSKQEVSVVLNPLEHEAYVWQACDAIFDWDWMPGGKSLLDHFIPMLHAKIHTVCE